MKPLPLRVASPPSPFPVWHRAARLAWAVVEGTVFRLSPPPLHWWRVVLLRLFGARVHATAHVYPTVRTWAPWNLALGPDACLAPDVRVYNVDRVVLGPRALVSQGAHLCTASHDHEDPAFPLVHAPIRIGEDAWVCADAFVAMGVTIGRGAVIGARAVVLRDMPAGMVCVGFPCRPVRARRRAASP